MDIDVLELEKRIRKTESRVEELVQLTRRIVILEEAELRRIKKEMKKEPEIQLASDNMTFMNKVFKRFR
jgi:hypothetical protein